MKHRHKSLCRSNHSTYIRRHISTSGNAQFVDESAQLESMENSSLRADNQLRKTNHFSTESLISGHKCSNRLQATPHSTSGLAQNAAKRTQLASTEKLHAIVAP